MKEETRIAQLERYLKILRDKVVNIDELLFFKTADEYNFNLPQDMRLSKKDFADLKTLFASL